MSPRRCAIQEVQTRFARPARKSLNDIRGNGAGRFPQLTAKLELLERRKVFKREQMEFDEQIVRALPGD